ncbi:MAG: cytochrome c [Acidobacteria bacterium]|nr:cytochrome c [Acidobacteriota bacterium]
MKLKLLMAAALPAASLFAHITVSTKITWSKEIARIVNQRCISCHRPEGAAAAVRLDSYEAARPWAKAIQEEVLTRRMPPWGAVKGFGDFSPDEGLTQEELILIAEWAEGGAPEGDPNFAPPLPRRPEPLARPLGLLRPISAPMRILSPTTLTALEASAPVRITAHFPDGRVEPLLWVLTAPRSATTYRLREPLKLPAGSRLETTGPAKGYFRTTIAKPSPAKEPPAQGGAGFQPAGGLKSAPR